MLICFAAEAAKFCEAGLVARRATLDVVGGRTWVRASPPRCGGIGGRGGVWLAAGGGIAGGGLFQEVVVGGSEGVPDGAQLGGLDMLRAALYFDQRLARHGHALKLEHTNELRLADALFQPQAAYISADVYSVALYLCSMARPRNLNPFRSGFA